MILRIVLIYLAVDVGVVLFSILQGNNLWFINTQVAFFSSLIIVLGSFFSYQNSIKARVETYEANETNDRDDIDKIEDKFDLYDDEKEQKPPKVKTLDMFKNLKYSGSFLSIYRVIGYVVLVGGFLALVQKEYFDIYSYLFGLFIVPIVSMFAIFAIKR